ncbi:MAG TPA: sugar porter family MFS transporter [Ktedonobacterales bacterium]|nr:sugar porter family MFS transporter [Ktedonobacterales bacterium]
MALPMQDQNFQQDQIRTPKTLTRGRRYAYIVSAVAALGGLLFGYDTGVISGALLYLNPAFHLSSTTSEIAVSVVLIGAILGAAAGGRMADTLGRKKSLIILGIIFACGAILTALSPNLGFFIAFRIVVGFGIGAASMITPMYIAELAPPAIRGALVTFNQLAVTVGIAVAYWVDLAFANAGMGWRPMFAVAFIPGSILAIGMFFLSETPRWLAGKNRWDDASAALEHTLHGEQKQQELQEIRTSLEEERKTSVKELFTPGLRLALLVAVGLAVFQQFVGINTVIYYAPTIFGYAGFSSASAAILATSIVGVVNVLATILSLLLVDHVGRRPLLLTGVSGMIVTLAAMGVVFLIGPEHAGWFVLICLLVYILSFAIGMGPVFWLMSAEMFPNRLRASGASIATIANWGANLLVSITFLTLIGVAGKPATFWIYAFLAVLALLFCWWLVPETKGKTLERIEWYWKNGRRWTDKQAA